MPDSTPRTVTIDLSAPGDAQSRTHIVQVEAERRINDILEEQFNAREAIRSAGATSGTSHDRPHNAIAVLGGRGSGKTTFLLSILDRLARPEGSGGWKGRVVNLGLLDPTLVSAKENIFLTIVSRIKTHIDRASRQHDKDSEKRRAWDRSLQSIAGGISALDDVGHNHLHDKDWGDEHFVLDEGLTRVRNNAELEERFDCFLKNSLDLLDAKVFCIGIDDIDTAFDRGWMVLETLRRYLTSRNLVVLIAGDIELFSALVRKRQWDNLGNLPLEHEPDRKAHYDRLIDRLEDQYLLKIIKPENRIFLDTLDHLNRLPGITIQVPLSNGREERLADVVDGVLEKLLFVREPDDVRRYREAILREPIRTVAQLLRGAKDLLVAKDPVPLDVQSRAIDRLLHVLTGPLWSLSLQPHQVRGMTARDIGPLVTVPLVRSDRLDPGYRLDLDFADPMTNLGLMGLGAKVASLIAEKPQVAIDFMIKVGLTREIQLSGPSNPRERRQFMQEYMNFSGVNGAEHTLGVARRATAFLNRDPEAKTTVHRGTVALWGSDMDRGMERDKYNPLFSMYGLDVTSGGSISEINVPPELKYYWDAVGTFMMIHRLKDTATPGRADLGIYYNRLHSLESVIDSPEIRGLVTLPLQRVIGPFDQTLPVLSIHNLIALISHVLECDDKEQINLLLRRSAQLRSYPVPEASGRNDIDVVRFDDELAGVDDRERVARYGWAADQGASMPHSFPVLSEELESWSKHWKDQWSSLKVRLPVFAIAAMWTRFFYTLEEYDRECHARRHAAKLSIQFGAIEYSVDQRRVYAGEALHRMIVAFLNAVLVEEKRYNGRSKLTGIDLRNPAASDDTFIGNLEQVDDELSYFQLVWSFPLWGLYLNSSSKVYIQYKNNLKNSIHIDHKMARYNIDFGDRLLKYRGKSDKNLYPLLNSLLLRRPAILARPRRNSSTDTPAAT